MTKNLDQIRKDFPILATEMNQHPLTYLDNGATTLKPKVVVDRLSDFYLYETSNIHRGVYPLSERATQNFEDSRTKVQNFLKARTQEEIIFTGSTTQSINLVANLSLKTPLNPNGWIGEGDWVLITELEHHANIVPWQLMRDLRLPFNLTFIPLSPSGDLDLVALKEILSKIPKGKLKMLSLNLVSNSLGTINPVKKIIELVKNHTSVAKVLIDGAQAVSHFPVDVQDLGCDFFAFSGHKIFAPTGIGVLYGKLKMLESMPPFLGGGDMIESVTMEKSTFAPPPQRFEAGTPPIAEAISLGVALDYLQNDVGWTLIEEQEKKLSQYARQKLSQIEGLRMIGEAQEKVGVFSFVLKGIHPHDIGSLLGQWGIAIRSGHHCTQPVMKYFNVPATNRASLSFYNTTEDIDRLVAGIKKIQQIFN
jgi:cysteine desulfurase/selenocysteine lyase